MTPERGLLGVPLLFWILRGQKGLSKLGTIANNGENIASGRQSFGMGPRNLRPCGRQRALSACRPGSRVWSLPFL